MTVQEATILVESHIKWLEDAGEYGGDRLVDASAIKWLLFYMGKGSHEAKNKTSKDETQQAQEVSIQTQTFFVASSQYPITDARDRP